MIKNATILRITKPSNPSTGGVVTFSPAATVLSVRCCQSAPTRRQVFQLGATIKDATAVVRVLTPELGGLTIEEGDQLETQLDGRAAETFLVLRAIDTVKRGLSNRVAFMQKQ